jgi:hypothetical protein
MRDIWLLRLRAPLARAHRDDAAYADFRGLFGFTYDALGSQYVIYTSRDNHVHMLYFPGDNGGWQDIDLTYDTGAPQPASHYLAGYVFAAEGAIHVVYSATDNNIWELRARVVP